MSGCLNLQTEQGATNLRATPVDQDVFLEIVMNDTYIEWYYYDAATSDVWGGYGYADEADGYTAGEWWDAGTGWYSVTSVVNLGYDTGWEGYTEATWGYDAQTGLYVDSDGWGSGGPGTEEGYAYFGDGTTDWFGGPAASYGFDTIEY